jgi:hypothetical protein
MAGDISIFTIEIIANGRSLGQPGFSVNHFVRQ